MFSLAVQPRDIPEETPKNYENPQSDIQCPGGDQNVPPPPCKSKA